MKASRGTIFGNTILLPKFPAIIMAPGEIQAHAKALSSNYSQAGASD